MLELIKEIKDAEKEATLKIKEAGQESKKILKETKEESKKIVDEAVKRANSKSDKTITKYKLKAGKEAAAIIEGIETKLEELRSQAKTNMEKAKKVVIEKVKGR